jgi:hypothetical protein
MSAPSNVAHPSWGPWTYDPKSLTLNLGADHQAARYYVDLEECRTSAATMDRIFQIAGKTWATPEVMHGLITAIDDLLDPQATLCSWGVERGPIKSADHIATLRRLRQKFYWRDADSLATDEWFVYTVADLLKPPPPDYRPELDVEAVQS